MVQWVWDTTQHQLHSANGVGFLALFPQLWSSSCHKPQGLCRHVIVLAPYGEYSWNSHAECVMSDQFTWLQILCSCYTQMFHFIFYVSTSPINPLILRLNRKESSVCSHVFQCWETLHHSTSGVWIGKMVPGRTSAPRVRLHRLQFGIPTYNPRMQTDLIINLWANHTSGLMLMLFVLPCKIWYIVKSGAWLLRPPPGAQQSQDFSPSYLWCSHSRQWGHSQSVQCPDRFLAKSEVCSAWTLKPN